MITNKREETIAQDMEDSVAVKANREVEAMGEVGDAAGEAGAGNGGVKEQARGEGEAGDAAGEVGGDGMGEAGAAVQVRNRFEFDVISLNLIKTMFQYFYYI